MSYTVREWNEKNEGKIGPKKSALVWYAVLNKSRYVPTKYSPYSTGYYRVLSHNSLGFVTVKRVDYVLKEEREIFIEIGYPISRYDKINIHPHPNGDYFILSVSGRVFFYNSDGITIAPRQDCIFPHQVGSFDIYTTVSFLKNGQILISATSLGSVILEDFKPSAFIYKNTDVWIKVEKDKNYKPKHNVLADNFEFLQRYSEDSYDLWPLVCFQTTIQDESKTILLERVGEYEIVLIEYYLEKSSDFKLVYLTLNGTVLSDKELALVDPEAIMVWKEYKILIRKFYSCSYSCGCNILKINIRKNDRYIVFYIIDGAWGFNPRLTLFVMDKRTQRVTLITKYRIHTLPLVILKGKRVTLFRNTPYIDGGKGFFLTPKLENTCDDFDEISCYEPHTLWTPRTHKRFLPKIKEYFFQIFLCLYGFMKLPLELTWYIMEMADEMTAELLE